MQDDITLLKNHLPRDISNNLPESATKNQGQVVVIIEKGIVATQQEISLNLPIFTRQHQMRFYRVALPSYANNLTRYSPLRIQFQGKDFSSAEIVRIQSLAAKQLKDNLPATVTRQIVRLVAKEEIRQLFSRKNGELGNLFASLYNLATEKADTRSWSTLPDSIDIMRLNLPVGEHQLTLTMDGLSQQVNVLVNPQKITLIKLTAIGRYFQYQSYNL